MVNALTKVGESITFSAFTVIAALLSLLFATFQIYSNLGIPLAIGIGVMLLAGLTLLPALLAIFGRPRSGRRSPSRATSSTGAWGRIATRVVKRPAASLLIGVIVFGALSVAVTAYQSAGFGGTISAPAGTDSAAGTDLLNKYFPSPPPTRPTSSTSCPTPAWEDAAAIADGDHAAAAAGRVHRGDRTAQPGRRHRVHAGRVHRSCTRCSAPGRCRPRRRAEPAAVAQAGITADAVGAGVPAVPGDRAVRVARTARRSSSRPSLTAGDPSTTAALNAVPAVRAEAATVVPTLHATDYGVAARRPPSTTSARSPTATWRT